MRIVAAVSADDSGEALSPGMQQYMEVKRRHGDMLLFYRMGDFYELFFEDALKAAAILDIALTKRGTFQGKPIPMCGVPYHAAENYLERLIVAGQKVAICEQLETPEEAKKRGHKSVLKRDVVRVITPGTLTEDSLLAPSRANYLASIARQQDGFSFAWVDISTGEFGTIALEREAIAAAIARFDPSEILMDEALQRESDVMTGIEEYRPRITFIASAHAEVRHAKRQLLDYYQTRSLDGLGEMNLSDIAACGMLCDYIQNTQKGVTPRLDAPRKLATSQFMQLDAATRRNLELTHTLAGERKGSLLSVLDMAVTAAGGRLLANRLAQPLADAALINERLDAVGWCIEFPGRAAMRQSVRQVPDMERALGRLHVGRGGPRDMLSLLAGLTLATELYGRFQQLQEARFPAEIAGIIAGLGNYAALTEELGRALKEDGPLLARDGGFIRSGYHPALDEFRSLKEESTRVIGAMEQRYAKESGIPTLKIKYNHVLGYFVELTRRHEASVPPSFIHRQTMKDALRYTTVELGEMEQKILRSAGEALRLELELYDALLERILQESARIIATARALGVLDLTLGAAEIAVARRYCRPVVDASARFEIIGGRHPVVEQAMRTQTKQPFIANDCTLEETTRLWLLTGPNMAGKSTFLRQNALIALIAQIGCYVPAESAHIGAVDRLFSRVGAADDLAKGHSTFMVEMVETAAILNQATSRSLVILDEIGRGTATYDGLSIAWAVVEHLHGAVRCRGLFATHYHELTQLSETLPSLACYTMRVKEWRGDITFLHEVRAGTADRSYGIHVAKLAGLPAPVLERARSLLHLLESAETNPVRALSPDALPLFHAGSAVKAPVVAVHPVIEQLRALDIESLNAREALELLYTLKASVG